MKRILVVDDEAEIPSLLECHMIAHGYDVYTALEGSEALKKVQTLHPDAVLLDIMMPGKGGIEVLREIKKSNPRIAVVMMTAIIDNLMLEMAFQRGADGYVIKPFDFYSFGKELREAIDICQAKPAGQKRRPHPAALNRFSGQPSCVGVKFQDFTYAKVRHRK